MMSLADMFGNDKKKPQAPVPPPVQAPPVLSEGQYDDARIATLAYRLAMLDQQAKRTYSERGVIAEELLAAMKARGLKRVPVPDFDVTLEVVDYNSRAQITKSFLVEHFGEAAKKLWENLPVSKGSRISVKNNKKAGK